MRISGTAARAAALAVAAMIVGVVGGMLLAARAPLWPAPQRPLLGIWHGHWRQSASGGLERFAASLECGELPGHRLRRAALITAESMQCRYEPAEGEAGDVVLVELVHSPEHAVELLRAAYPGRVSTAEERVAVADGAAAGQRSTVRSASVAAAGLDALVVRGAQVAVEVACVDFGGGVDAARCRAAQTAFFASWKAGLTGHPAPR